MEITDLGVYQDSNATFEEKVAASESSLRGDDTVSNYGKAICWLTYRYLEGLYNNDKFIEESFPKVFEAISKETDQFIHYRWHSSCIAARSYFMILTDRELRPKLLDGKSLRHNPFTMVNISRLCILRALFHISNNQLEEGRESIKLLHNLYRRFISMVEFENQPACVGYELELIARMIRVSIMLYPHLNLPYTGASYTLQQISKIEPTEPFYQSFCKLIRKTKP